MSVRPGCARRSRLVCSSMPSKWSQRRNCSRLHAESGVRSLTRVSVQESERRPEHATNGVNSWTGVLLQCSTCNSVHADRPERSAHRVLARSRVSRPAGSGGKQVMPVSAQNRCFSDLQVTRAEMSVRRGQRLHHRVCRLPPKGGSFLILLELQSRNSRAVQADSGVMSQRPILSGRSRNDRWVSAARGATSSATRPNRFCRLMHAAKGDNSATVRLLKLRDCSRGQRAEAAMFFTPVTPSKSAGWAE